MIEKSLKCYRLPKAIRTNTYFCSLEHLKDVVKEMTDLGWEMPKFVELSIFLIKSPPTLAMFCRSMNGKICMISAVCFARTHKEAQTTLAVLEKSRLAKICLAKSVFESSHFPKLMENAGLTWPENHRVLAENFCSNAEPADVFMALRDKFINAPSDKSVIAFCLSTGQHQLLQPQNDLAFSMEGNLYGGSWAIWENPREDETNRRWQEEMLLILKPFTNLHYIGETDFIQDPACLQQSFTPEKWMRLQEIRKTYDPDGLFFDYHTGIK